MQPTGRRTGGCLSISVESRATRLENSRLPVTSRIGRPATILLILSPDPRRVGSFSSAPDACGAISEYELFSEIAAIEGLSNLPDDPELAIAAGRGLCENLLEPLQATFGRIAIRSAYRSPEVISRRVERHKNLGDWTMWLGIARED
jgi:hypothetical protein